MLSSDKPQVGDKVRISYEGVVFPGTETEINIKGDDGRCFYFVKDDTTSRTIEILERAKPKWKDGDVVRVVNARLSSFGQFHTRVDGAWYDFNRDKRGVDEDCYVLVMRDGKFV